MPTYEYRCQTPTVPGCGQSFDLFRTISQRDAAVTCPQCGAEHTATDAAGRLTARPITAPGPGQVLIPGHFGHTVSTTGLQREMGNGPWQDLHRRNTKWDSGANAPSRRKDRPVEKVA